MFEVVGGVCVVIFLGDEEDPVEQEGGDNKLNKVDNENPYTKHEGI